MLNLIKSTIEIAKIIPKIGRYYLTPDKASNEKSNSYIFFCETLMVFLNMIYSRLKNGL
jgi:hypothetical protein